ncbi:MAG: bifunctional metallophosphatase/5'-nucleotidase [Candidatus Aminicenantales bacterium]
MKKTVRFLLSVLLLSALAAGIGCAPAALLSPAPGETRVVIFHSNDVHAKIDNFAKVAAILERERKRGADVYYLSAGDNFTGNPIVDRYDPPGEPMLEIYNRLGLDLLGLGNHEFDYGWENLERYIARARFTALAANVQPPPGAFPQLRPSVVLKTKNGLKIAVFGLIQVEAGSGLPSTSPMRIKGFSFRDPFQTALDMKTLRPGNNVLIALTHIGYDQDRRLAEQMPELDVIIGGHSHTRINPAEIVNGVLIAQTGSDNRYLGRVELLIRNGRVVEKKGGLIDLQKRLREDPEIKAMIARFNLNPGLTRILAEAPFVITGKDALGCLMTDAWRFVLGFDIAFQNIGGIRLNRLGNKITLKDVYALDPFDNQVVEIGMTAAEIRGLIRWTFEMGGDIDLQVSGLTYTVRAGADRRVREVELRGTDGNPIPEDRTYRVGLSSFVASAYKFEHKDPGRALGVTTADVLIRFLEGHPDLSVYRGLQRAYKEIVTR